MSRYDIQVARQLQPHVCVYVRVNNYMIYIYTYICVCMYVYTHVYMQTKMYMYVYDVYVRGFIQTRPSGSLRNAALAAMLANAAPGLAVWEAVEVQWLSWLKVLLLAAACKGPPDDFSGWVSIC